MLKISPLSEVTGLVKRMLRQIELANGLTLIFHDATHRYFGDYHQVKLEIRCEVLLTRALFDDEASFEAARRVLGGTVCYQKIESHQGVATAQIEAVVERLMDQFLKNTLGYLESDTFPRRLVQTELKRRAARAHSFLGRTGHA